MAEPLPHRLPAGGLLPGRYSYFSAPPWFMDTDDQRRGGTGAYFELDHSIYDNPGGWAASTFAPDVRDFIETENRNVSFAPYSDHPTTVTARNLPVGAFGRGKDSTYGEIIQTPDVAYFTQSRPELPSPVAEDKPLVSGEQRSTFPIPTTQWFNPDTEEVVDIGQGGPQYFSGLSTARPKPEGFLGKVGDFFTRPGRDIRDMTQVPVMGSGVAAAARGILPFAIPGAGLLSLIAGALGGGDETPFQYEGKQVTDIGIGPNQTWLGAADRYGKDGRFIEGAKGGGYYMYNDKIDMSKLGGGREKDDRGNIIGRDITVHTDEGPIAATYRVDDTGAASITSEGFGAPGVDYGDIYYGGADYEGLDTGSDEQWDAYWGDW